MQDEKEDDGEAASGNTGVKYEDKDGNLCVVVILVAAQVEDAQGECADKGEGEGKMCWLSLSRCREIMWTMSRTMASQRTTIHGSMMRTRMRTRTR